MDFITAKKMFAEDKIAELAVTDKGRKFLKLRSISRKEHLEGLFAYVNQSSEGWNSQEMFSSSFENPIFSEDKIDSYIKEIDLKQRNDRIQNKNGIINELYKLDFFDWGGLHQNSLEKTIVNNYVKKIWEYDILEKKVEGELHVSLRGYVLSSWYNHWTSILIEDIFKNNQRILPAVSQIKKIDFFIDKTPFDLKVTYFPEGYLSLKRKQNGLSPEITILKKEARNSKIPINKDLPKGKLLEDLWKKVQDSPNLTSKKVIKELKNYREGIVNDLEKNPNELLVWLYENQGERRFDASNRLFLILVDLEDYFSSWKLKRAFPLIENKVNEFLNSGVNSGGREITFKWEEKEYSTIAEIILIRRES